MPSITGNVGGTAGSGARVHIRNKNNSYNTSANADSSGDFTFTVADKDTYLLDATLSGFLIRGIKEVVVNGSNVAAINFAISSINSSNI